MKKDGPRGTMRVLLDVGTREKKRKEKGNLGQRKSKEELSYPKGKPKSRGKYPGRGGVKKGSCKSGGQEEGGLCWYSQLKGGYGGKFRSSTI